MLGVCALALDSSLETSSSLYSAILGMNLVKYCSFPFRVPFYPGSGLLEAGWLDASVDWLA